MKTFKSLIALLLVFTIATNASTWSRESLEAFTLKVAAASFTTPVATSFSTTVAANRQNAVQLQGFDAEGTSLVYATTTSPAHGTLSGLNTATGAVVYTPVTDYVGADSFNFTVTSGGQTSTAGTVTLTVTNAKTRIIDTLTDAGGSPLTGKVTFILTQPTTSPGGLIPKGATVSAVLNVSGQFDVSVYPSRSLTPTAYYQVNHVNAAGTQTLLGIYDVPLSTATVNLAPYKVMDMNLAAQYTFASQAAVLALSEAVSGAVYASLSSGNVTTALGYTPLRPSLNLSDVANAGTARTSLGLGNVDNTSDATKNAATATLTNKTLTAPIVTGGMSVSGGLTASNLNLVGAVNKMLTTGALPYSPDTISGFLTFLDAAELDLTQGDLVQTWPDLSGNARNGTQATSGLRLSYYASETAAGTFSESDRPFVVALDTTKYATVPVPADETKTIYLLAKRQAAFPGSYLLYFDTNNHIFSLGNRWHAYRVSGSEGTTPKGYMYEWSVLTYVQTSATSVSFYVDGQLAQTFTPQTNPGVFTSFKIGPGAGFVRMVGVLDHAHSAADVAIHYAAIRASNGLTWEHDWIDETGGYAPTLSTPALVVKKQGLKGNRPLVILNHAAGFDERMFFDTASYRSILTALVERGYIVAISRLTDNTATGENNWGNQAAIDANVELYDYVVANYNVDTTKVAMIGLSMGGLATALAFVDGNIPVKGAACIDCVFDLAHVYANGFSTGINTAYNIPGGGNYATQTAGHDPRLLGAHASFNKRFRFYRNTGDVTVNPTENTGDFAAQIASVATEEDIVSSAGTHLQNIEGMITDLLTFLDRVFV
jgi:pimeloyl-ACP methyl ester carboxylesterase